MCDRVLDEDGKRGTGGGVSCLLGTWRGTGGDECIIAVGGEDWIRGDEGGAASGSSASASGLKASEAGIVASEDSSWAWGLGGSGSVHEGWGGNS